MAKIKSANGTIWKVQDVYIDKDDKTWITKNLFIKNGCLTQIENLKE